MATGVLLALVARLHHRHAGVVTCHRQSLSRRARPCDQGWWHSFEHELHTNTPGEQRSYRYDDFRRETVMTVGAGANLSGKGNKTDHFDDIERRQQERAR